ncbi:MAG: CDP-alcohol phosphatidyltransferase family protein [Chloroflexi bacterium]|nr:MAG: CDP-alcohol phosphatidyltransferase family protein [Chloroflexota bacterium]
MENLAKKAKPTFTDMLRVRFKGIIEPIASFLNRLGMRPNTATLLGLFGTVVGSVFLAIGQITVGGIILLIFAPVDALDGTMARLRGESSEFGAFVDSVTDRYAELVTFGGLAFYFSQQNNSNGVILTYAAAAGSVLVSYIRARAQSVGFETKIGIFSRVERYIVLIPCLIFNIPLVAVGLIAVFANITALQRIWHVRAQAHEKMALAEKK